MTSKDQPGAKFFSEKDWQNSKILEGTFASLSDALFIVDPNTRIVMRCNSAVQKIFGYTPDEVLGRSTEFLHVDRESYLQFAKQLFPTLDDQGIFHADYKMRRKDGEIFISEHTINQILDDNGKRTAVVSIVRDIGKRKQVEQHLQSSRNELRSLAYRLSEAQELERKRISQELHDQVGQMISVIGMNLSMVRSLLPKNISEQVLDLLDDASDTAEGIGRRVRAIMDDLRPPSFDDHGLLSALQEYVARFSQRTGITYEIIGDPGDINNRPDLKIALFRIAQEAIINIGKHAKASRLTICFETLEEGVRMSISDDGCGFDPTLTRNLTIEGGIGLVSMRERATAVGATYRVESQLGQGTRVVVEWLRHIDED
jgi:PAS domain S-box-containing protein